MKKMNLDQLLTIGNNENGLLKEVKNVRWLVKTFLDVYDIDYSTFTDYAFTNAANSISFQEFLGRLLESKEISFLDKATSEKLNYREDSRTVEINDDLDFDQLRQLISNFNEVPVETESVNTTANKVTKALRFNEGKLDWTLVNFDSLEPLVAAMTYGATKYERNNWMNECEDPNQHIQSAFRHLVAMASGETYDKESGVRHSGHLLANMMMYNYHTKNIATYARNKE